MSEYAFIIFTILSTSTIVAIKCNIWWMWIVGYLLARQVRKVNVVTVERSKEETKEKRK